MMASLYRCIKDFASTVPPRDRFQVLQLLIVHALPMPYANFVPTHPLLHAILSVLRFAILHTFVGPRAGLWSYYSLAWRFGSFQLFPLLLVVYLEGHVGTDTATVASHSVGGWSCRAVGDGAKPTQHLRLFLCQAEHSISGGLFVCGSPFV